MLFMNLPINNIHFNKILDLGCGTGIILKEISSKNSSVELFGLDLSENMIAQATRRLGTAAKLTVGDAENLPYLDNTFDLVCCVESFHHYPNPKKALSEINRVLKKGGLFLLCDTWTSSPLRQIMNFFIRFSNDGDVHIYSENAETEKTAELMDNVSKLYEELISFSDLYDSASFEAKKMIVNQLIRRVDVYRGYQLNITFNFDLTPYIEGDDAAAC